MLAPAWAGKTRTRLRIDECVPNTTMGSELPWVDASRDFGPPLSKRDTARTRSGKRAPLISPVEYRPFTDAIGTESAHPMLSPKRKSFRTPLLGAVNEKTPRETSETQRSLLSPKTTSGKLTPKSRASAKLDLSLARGSSSSRPTGAPVSTTRSQRTRRKQPLSSTRGASASSSGARSGRNLERALEHVAASPGAASAAELRAMYLSRAAAPAAAAAAAAVAAPAAAQVTAWTHEQKQAAMMLQNAAQASAAAFAASGSPSAECSSSEAFGSEAFGFASSISGVSSASHSARWAGSLASSSRANSPSARAGSSRLGSPPPPPPPPRNQLLTPSWRGMATGILKDPTPYRERSPRRQAGMQQQAGMPQQKQAGERGSGERGVGELAEEKRSVSPEKRSEKREAWLDGSQTDDGHKTAEKQRAQKQRKVDVARERIAAQRRQLDEVQQTKAATMIEAAVRRRRARREAAKKAADAAPAVGGQCGGGGDGGALAAAVSSGPP